MDHYVSSLVQYNAKTAGRDKIYRLIQYASKFISGSLDMNNKDTIAKVKALESTLSIARKTYRLGKFIDMIQAALKCMNHKDPVLKFLISTSHLCSAGFLFYDSLSWAAKAKITTGDPKKWSKYSTTLWMISSILKLLRDFYELQKIIQMRSCNSYHEKEVYLSIIKYDKRLIVDFLKNLSDLIIAMQSSGNLSVSQSTVGLCGIVSSALGILEIVNPQFRL